MRTAITAKGKGPDDLIDNHFGRCAYFVIYDDETRSIEYIPNPNRTLMESAGPVSAEFLVARGISKIVSAEFGQKVKEMFDKLKIQLIVVREEKSVSEIISLLENAGKN